MDKELAKVFESFILEASKKTEPLPHNTSFSNIQSGKKTHGERGQLTRKEFVPRNSMLTDLFEIPHIQTIQYVFIAVLIIFGIHTIMNDIFDYGTIGVDLHIWVWAFGKFPYVVTTWCTMQGVALLGVYLALCCWATYRGSSPNRNIVDYVFLACYVCYQLVFAAIPLYVVNHWELPPASASIVVAEQVRFMMKSHAFVREKIPDITKATVQKDVDPYPNLGNYVYFQFVPTLVYRDNYPRTKEIRWNFVFLNFAHVIGGIAYCYYVFVRFCVPVFRNFNHEHVNFKTFMRSIFDCILPGSLNLLVVFYGFLHAWMNAWAEMLRFADRLFYKDWWNCTSFASYYRTWNGVVHDWLYTYVYSDIYRLGGPAYRNLALFVTFVLSALVHEYIICCLLRIFYPVMFVMFGGFGVWMFFASYGRQSRPWNVLLWFGLFVGQGIFLCLYSCEYYARYNCPPTTDGFLDYIIPRSWNCYVIQPVINSTLSRS
ncbi:sterol O-acyltransferase 1-like isoform X2 [Paramacrobiotus metropolitanus]|nr:sterol O-acyltransferase 1-like isoform X2 [Paramacrobiotus metropolitanus]